MRLFSLLLMVSLAGCATHRPFHERTVIDLTHGFDETTVYWPTADGFELRRLSAGMTERGFYYAANTFCTAEHGGTHIDAPIHFSEGRLTVDRVCCCAHTS